MKTKTRLKEIDGMPVLDAPENQTHVGKGRNSLYKLHRIPKGKGLFIARSVSSIAPLVSYYSSKNNKRGEFHTKKMEFQGQIGTLVYRS